MCILNPPSDDPSSRENPTMETLADKTNKPQPAATTPQESADLAHPMDRVRPAPNVASGPPAFPGQYSFQVQNAPNPSYLAVPSQPARSIVPSLSPATAEIVARVQSRINSQPLDLPKVESLRASLPPHHITPPQPSHGMQEEGSISKDVPSVAPRNTNPGALISRPPVSSSASALDTTNTSSSHSTGPATNPDHPTQPYRPVAGSSSFVAPTHHFSLPNQSDLTPSVSKALYTSTIPPPMPATSSVSSTSSSSSTRRRTYVLPDGTVLHSGKGLGRGRPGIKRGPRKPKSETPSAEVAAQGIPTYSLQIEKKRKRSIDTAEDDQRSFQISTSDDDDDDELSDDSVEYNPQATQTRSGRHTNRPETYVPMDSPAAKKVHIATEGPTPQRKTPVIKRKAYQGKEQNALCEHCLRGHGPSGNVIVFCDACNRCWHQRCHDPMVPKALVVDSKAEWFCTECTEALGKAPKTTTNSAAPTTTTAPLPPLRNNVPLVGGRPLSEEQKRKYLNSLSRDRLVDLVLHVSTLAPDLLIFPLPPPSVPSAAAVPPPPQPPTTPPRKLASQTRSTSKRKLSDTPTPTPSTSDYDDEDDDEDDDLYLDEHSQLYPKPGYGIAAGFPPESEDLWILLEGGESTTFSHSLRGAVAVGV